jgi:hypothetical protein
MMGREAALFGSDAEESILLKDMFYKAAHYTKEQIAFLDSLNFEAR